MTVQNSIHPYYDPLVKSLREEYLSKGDFKGFPIHVNHSKEVTLGEGHSFSFTHLEPLFEALVSIFKGQEHCLYCFYQKLAHSLKGHVPDELDQKLKKMGLKGHLYALIEQNAERLQKLENLDKKRLDYEELKSLLEHDKNPYDFELALTRQKSLQQKLLSHLIKLCPHNETISEMVHILLGSSDLEFGTLAADEAGNTAFHYAALSGDLKTLKKLKKGLHDFAKAMNQPNKEGLTPIHYAIRFKQFEFAKKLLAKDGDINVEVPFGKWTAMTPLLFSILDENMEALKFCLSQKNINIYATDAEERNALHFAKRNQSSKIWKFLDEQPSFKILLEKTDIYGKNPLEFTATDLDISQEKVREKFHLYLKLKGRDTSILGEGSCNGLGFLVFFYDNCSSLDEFYNSLKAFVRWDGSEEALKTKITFSENYKDLDDLFEQWIQDIVWFQHCVNDLEERITPWSQADRKKMLEVAKKNEKIDLDMLMPETATLLTKEQLAEILEIFSLMPDTVLEIAGAEHLVSSKVHQDSYKFYDSNLPHKTKIFRSKKELATVIYNVKYRKMHNQPVEKMPITLTVYRYNSTAALKKINIEERVQKKSSNGFTPLHLALLARNQHLFLKYMKTAELNQADVHGNTPLSFAILLGQNEYVKWLLQDPRIDLNAKFPLKTAILQNNEEAFNLLISHPKIDVKGALYYAVRANQPEYVKALLKAFPHLDSNEEPDDMVAPIGALDEALRQKNFPLIEMLLNHKADLFKKNSSDMAPVEYIAKHYQDEKELKAVLKYVKAEQSPKVLKLAKRHFNETLTEIAKQVWR